MINRWWRGIAVPSESGERMPVALQYLKYQIEHTTITIITVPNIVKIITNQCSITNV